MIEYVFVIGMFGGCLVTFAFAALVDAIHSLVSDWWDDRKFQKYWEHRNEEDSKVPDSLIFDETPRTVGYEEPWFFPHCTGVCPSCGSAALFDFGETDFYCPSPMCGNSWTAEESEPFGTWALCTVASALERARELESCAEEAWNGGFDTVALSYDNRAREIRKGLDGKLDDCFPY